MGSKIEFWLRVSEIYWHSAVKCISTWPLNFHCNLNTKKINNFDCIQLISNRKKNDANNCSHGCVFASIDAQYNFCRAYFSTFCDWSLQIFLNDFLLSIFPNFLNLSVLFCHSFLFFLRCRMICFYTHFAVYQSRNHPNQNRNFLLSIVHCVRRQFSRKLHKIPKKY